MTILVKKELREYVVGVTIKIGAGIAIPLTGDEVVAGVGVGVVLEMLCF